MSCAGVRNWVNTSIATLKSVVEAAERVTKTVSLPLPPLVTTSELSDISSCVTTGVVGAEHVIAHTTTDRDLIKGANLVTEIDGIVFIASDEGGAKGLNTGLRQNRMVPGAAGRTGRQETWPAVLTPKASVPVDS